MKNRPLCSLCLVIAILIGILTAGAGAKFVSELRPSPVEQYGEKDDWLIVRGQVYKKEEKEKYQILYLKKCSVYFQKDQQSQQNQQSQQSLIKESRMLIYDEKKNKIRGTEDERDYGRICRGSCICAYRGTDFTRVWRGPADGELMKEMVEEYGGVILAALTGGIILALLVTGVRTDGGFRELLLLFFRGIGTEVA